MNMKPTAPKVSIHDAPGGDKETRKEHPAFGLVQFTRIQGGSRLFGSELNSHSFIQLEIKEATENYHLHRKTYSEGRLVARCDMTAAQFAELLTTMNVGSGVPCTIRFGKDGHVPDFTDGETVHDLILKDIEADTKGLSDLAAKLEAEAKAILEESGLSQAKRNRLTCIMAKIRQQIDDNMPFVLDQYQRAVAKTTSAGKAELDAAVTHAAMALGVESLRQLSIQAPGGEPKG